MRGGRGSGFLRWMVGWRGFCCCVLLRRCGFHVVVYVLSSSWHGYGLKVMYYERFFSFFRLQHLYRYRFRSFTFCLAWYRASPLLIGLGWVGLDTEVVEEGGYPMSIIFFTMHSYYIPLHSIHHLECCICTLQFLSTIHHPPLSPTSI